MASGHLVMLSLFSLSLYHKGIFCSLLPDSFNLPPPQLPPLLLDGCQLTTEWQKNDHNIVMANISLVTVWGGSWGFLWGSVRLVGHSEAMEWSWPFPFLVRLLHYKEMALRMSRKLDSRCGGNNTEQIGNGTWKTHIEIPPKPWWSWG